MSKSTAPAASPQQQLADLLQRWDAFLTKLEARYDESREQAIQAVLHQLREADYDIASVLTTTVAVEAQFRGLTEKIDQTWDKIGPQVEALGGFDVSLKAGDKGRALGQRLRTDTRHLRVEIDGRVAEAFWAHVMPLFDVPFHCSQCGGKLTPQRDTFKSHYVTCPYCQSVNTFLPHAKISQLQWYGADMIAAWRVLPERAPLLALEEEFSALRRDVGLAVAQEVYGRLLAAERHYQEAYHDAPPSRSGRLTRKPATPTSPLSSATSSRPTPPTCPPTNPCKPGHSAA